MRKREQQVIQAIYERDQRLTVSAVLKEARKKRSPLHAHFEWRDAVAAEEYRKQQARKIIREFVVYVGGKPHKLFHVPYEVWETQTHTTGKEGYWKTVQLATQTERERMRDEIISKILGLRRLLASFKNELTGKEEQVLLAGALDSAAELEGYLRELTH